MGIWGRGGWGGEDDAGVKEVGKSWLKKMSEEYCLLSLHLSSESPLVFKAPGHKISFHGVRCVTPQKWGPLSHTLHINFEQSNFQS